MANTMRGVLIQEGYARVFLPEHQFALQLLIKEMEKEGHAVRFSDEQISGKVTSASGYHYRTCEACKKGAS